MAIELSVNDMENRQMQVYGRKLARTLDSDAAISVSFERIYRWRKRIDVMGVISSLVFVGSLLIIALTGSANQYSNLATTLVFSMLFAIFSLVARSECSSHMRMHNVLASESALCAQLHTLALHSEAVTAYVRKVTAERQLRLFDIAQANVEYDSEQTSLTRKHAEQACVALHSL